MSEVTKCPSCGATETESTGFDQACSYCGHIFESKETKDASGNAHEAEYLVQLGFKHVFLIDLSPLALNHFLERVPNFPKEQLICADFFNASK